MTLLLARPAYGIDAEHPLPARLRRLAATAGREAPTTGMSFWTDAALLGAAGIPTVLFGPRGAGLHGIDEHVLVEDLDACADVFSAVVGNRRLKGPKAEARTENEAGRAAYTAVDPASRSRHDAIVAVVRGSVTSSGGDAHGRRQTVAADRGRWWSSPASRGRKCCTAGTSGRLQPEGADRGRRSRKRHSTTTGRPRTTRSE